MAPGPKKKSFHTPRNVKSNQNSKIHDKKISESNNDIIRTSDEATCSPIDFDITDGKKYSKRSIESNWTKYDEPPTDPHADSTKGHNFEALASNSGGSGTQFKFQDEREWEDGDLNCKDISLNFQDLVSAIKCIPFHERINVQNIFDANHIKNFVSVAEKFKTNYKPKVKLEAVESKDNATAAELDSSLTIIEEFDTAELDTFPSLKKFVVQEKTANIIDSLASNLTFKEFPEKEKQIILDKQQTEAVNNDLDFLLSLNVSIKEETSEVSKNPNVDDWLNSILDD